MAGNEQQTALEKEKPEGIDEFDRTVGWGEYPLDSVFVRTEQRAVSEVVRRINRGRFELNPEFQRDFVWPVEKQSRLIESCLMRIPLPVFYVAEARDGRIIVVDGLQRLTTFKRYLGDEFALTGLVTGDEEEAPPNPLSKKRFSDLPLTLQERIQDTQLTLYILDAKAPERAKLDIFERVNGGVPLTRQQMRNCLYNGPATRWLKDAADSDIFIVATGRSLDRKTMRDREAINRFCAFFLMGEDSYKSADMDGFLAEALDAMNDMNEAQIKELSATFFNSMRVNQLLFGRHAFRKSLASENPHVARTIINIALFDVCSVLLAKVTEEEVEARGEVIRNAVRELMQDSGFDHAISYSTNSTRQVVTRFYKAREALAFV